MTRRLLLVEPSATMRNVLEKHARTRGHDIEATGSYRDAKAVLERQFRAFESDIAAVILGWPSLPDVDADAFAARLENVDVGDLPVIVMSTDMRAETRAWVAGRERTAMLAWKDYLGMDALLERLLDDGGEEPTNGTPVAKFDNSDIHILVVDDSLTIRYSLRDLFELQGYRVSLAATREEALEAARATRFDIAVLDFYLENTTGDALCRDLVADPACGDVVCAILTGTYADHVIKRSLRAGAVECMFKHESSELLLTRIDAIGRFVRQRRELSDGVGRLSRVVESLAGAVLVVDGEVRLRHASGAALAVLGLDSLASVIGQSLHDLLGLERLPTANAPPVTMRWRDAVGATLSVNVTRLVLPGGDESLIGFERVEVEERSTHAAGTARETPREGARTDAVPAGEPPSSRNAVSSPSPVPVMGAAPTAAETSSITAPPGDRAESLVAKLHLPIASVPFIRCLVRYLDTVDERTERVSLLVIGLFEHETDGTHRPIAFEHELAPRIRAGIARLYRREHHVAALGGHRHALLLRHVDEPQSFLLTRRLMQLCNELLVAEGGPGLASTGCLVSLTPRAGRGAELVLDHAFRGLEIVEARGVDQALLLDLRRMLAVYPVPAGDGSTTGNARAPATGQPAEGSS